MKKLISFLLIIGIAMGLNAQKKGKKNKLSEDEKAAIDAVKELSSQIARIESLSAAVDYNSDGNFQDIDTLNTGVNKDEFLNLKSNNFTTKSKEVMDYYLNQISSPLVCQIDEKLLIFNQDYSGIKTIKTYNTDKKGKKNIFEEITFNDNGQPSSIKHFGNKGNLESQRNFFYENSILNKIVGGEIEVRFSYDDGKMIMSNNTETISNTNILHLENGKLLQKSYATLSDEYNQSRSAFSEEKVKDGCVQFIVDTTLSSTICSSKPGEFPFSYKSTSYLHGHILQTLTYKITKKSAQMYELFDINNKGDLNLVGTFNLNEKQLITSYNFFKSSDGKIEVEYSYFPLN